MIRAALVCAGAAAACVASPLAATEIPPPVIVATVGDWLADQDNADKWSEYLLLDELAEAAAAGADADPDVLTQAIDRLDADGEGLDRQELVLLRATLAQWLAELHATRQDPTEASSASDAVEQPNTAQLAVLAVELRAILKGRRSALHDLPEAAELPLDELSATLTTPDPDPAILAKFLASYDALLRPAPREPLPGLANLVAAYLDVSDAAAAPDWNGLVAAESDFWAESIALASEADTAAAADLAEQLVWMEHVGGFSTHRSHARRRFAQPNLQVRLSSKFLEQDWSTDVDEPTDVDEVILGTRIRGQGRTTGSFALDLRPCVAAAEVGAYFSGTAKAETKGRNGPAVICSDSTSCLGMPLIVAFDGRSVDHSFGEAEGTTTSRPTGYGATRGGLLGRIIRRSAAKQSAEQRPLADRIASRRAARRLERRLGARADAAADEANGRLNEAFARLASRALPLTSVTASTSDSAAFFAAKYSGAAGLAGDLRAPPLRGEGDVEIAVHQSWTNNFARDVLGGRTLAMDDLRAWLDEAGLPMDLADAAESSATPDGDSSGESELANRNLVITFARRGPILVEFRDGLLSAAIRAEQIEGGVEPVERMEIKVIYKPVVRDDALSLQFVEVEVAPLRFYEGAEARLSLVERGRVVKLRDQVAQRLESEFVPQHIGVPFRGPVQKEIVWRGASCEHGWLQLVGDAEKAAD